MRPARLLLFVLVGFVLSSDTAISLPTAEAQFDNKAGRNDNPFGKNNDEEAALLAGGFLMVILIIVVVVFAIMIFIYWLLYSALAAVPQQYREMEPGMVFLMLIPCFNLIWVFFVGARIPRSFQNYFEAHERYDHGDCGAQIGLWWGICTVCQIIPLVNYIAGPAALVLLIVFLVKISSMKGEIGRTR